MRLTRFWLNWYDESMSRVVATAVRRSCHLTNRYYYQYALRLKSNGCNYGVMQQVFFQ
ncbi:hypothetical protein THIX_110153 [Thiomonas sp. X19]|nr:hypothetical protein THIX_110153 [Thiomonas sp. X19]VDY07136.1 protein of unknown function [Thiomonas sp. Sup16B3]